MTSRGGKKRLLFCLMQSINYLLVNLVHLQPTKCQYASGAE